MAFRLNGLEINTDDIYSAYDARAELDAMLPDIENALAVFDEVTGVASGTNASIVDPALIAKIEKIKSSRADTGTLVRVCGEINSSHAHGNVLATVLLMRAVLNHVPPVFGVETFEQVVASRGKSQKESFEHLESGLRKIADFHTHRQIARVENYPSVRQVEPYKPQFEMLLHEVEAHLRDESRLKLPLKIKPTNIATAKGEKRGDDDKELWDWQVRHEEVAIQLSKINPVLQMRYADGTTRVLYTDLFPEPALQQAIETYIVRPNAPHTQFTVRKPPPHELRSPALRETVKTVETRIARFREENPVTAGIFKTTFH